MNNCEILNEGHNGHINIIENSTENLEDEDEEKIEKGTEIPNLELNNQDSIVDKFIDNLLDNDKEYCSGDYTGKQGTSLETNNHSSESTNPILTKDMIEEENKLEEQAIKEEKKLKDKLSAEERKMEEEKCFKRLRLLLSRSSIYAKFMADKIEQNETVQRVKNKKQSKIDSCDNDISSVDNAKKASAKRSTTSESRPAKKRKCDVNMMDVFKKENMANHTYEENPEENSTKHDSDMSRHPSLFYGGKMHPYQIEGYEWLRTLYENGVNGILADEMGLGKTIQTIAIIAYLVEMQVPGPFIVVGPLSTLPNWYAEFQRFTPDIPVLFYHGYKTDRQKLISKINQKVKNERVSCCPVIITSYQIALIDAKQLQRIEWKMLVVDEAHRIKNFKCRLVQALKSYNSQHRLLLTGTPLQNNLDELWSLLNFILPEIFDDLKVFQSWFDIQKLSQSGASQEIIAKEQEKQIVSTIHQILTPFLLRRTKADINLELPPKKEVVVYAPLTSLQQKYYSSVLTRTINKLLQVNSLFDEPLREKRLSKKTDFFGCEGELVNVNFDAIAKSEPKSNSEDELGIGEEVLGKLNLKLQNTQMILRHICNHPYIVYFPSGPVNEEMIKVSGKLLLLDQMLAELKKRGHKVIIFSQFVQMLRILEDYCDFRKYKYCTLYGCMNLDDREKEMESYKDNSTFIFLISTKAGGLGINIISADTVIIYDSDWNPQGDIQAQDRCHRIGQTRPVMVYRYIVPNTVDEKIIDYANAKKKLEKVILREGRFKSKNLTGSYRALTKEELLELLESAENCGYVKTNDTNVLSQEELKKLLDRSNMK